MNFLRNRSRAALAVVALLAVPVFAYVFTAQPAVYHDVVSREVTFWAGGGSNGYSDVISREVTFWARETGPGHDGTPADWMSREVTFRVLAPDLAIEAVAIPAEGNAETWYNVLYRVTNVGDTVTTQTWTDRLTFSGLIGGNVDVPNAVPLAVGESYVRELGPFMMPYDFSGPSAEFTITIDADYLNEQREDRDTMRGEVDCDDGECNNRLAQVVTVYAIDRPDLQAQITSLAPPNNGAGGYDSGTDVQVGFRVANVGPAPTASLEWVDRVYLVPDDGDANPPTDLTGAVALEDAQNLIYLLPGTGSEAGTYYDTLLDVSLPDNIPLPPDTSAFFRLAVETDATDAVLEDDVAPNVAFSDVLRVDRQPQPDLIVASITNPQPTGFWQTGEPRLIEWTIENVGAGPLAATVQDRLWLVNDGDQSVTDLGTYSGYVSLLAMGTTDDRAKSVALLPVNLPTGTYHLEIETDWSGVVTELDPGAESNNRLSSASFSVNESASPDFLPTYVRPAGGSTLVQAGSSLDVEWRVQNVGSPGWDLQLSWSDAVYLVPQADLATFDPWTASPIASFNEATVFGVCSTCTSDQWYVPEEYIKTRAITIPTTTPPGTYGLVLRSDSTGAVYEFNPNFDAEANNATDGGAAVLFTIESHPADLAISAGALIESTLYQPPASGAPGSVVELPWSVLNVSSDPLGAASHGWSDRVYLSPTTDPLHPQAKQLASVSSPAGLTPGDPALTHLVAASVPYVTAGSYQLVFWADRFGSVFDSDLGNNQVAVPFTVTAELSDLEVTAIAASGSAQPGDPLTVSWSVDNVGPASTSSSYWVDSVYLSADATPSPNGSNVWLGSVARTSSLAPGDAPYDVVRQFVLPTSLEADEYWVLVRSDSGNAVFESDEDNNWRATRMTVEVEEPPLANLTVQNVQAAASVVAGQPLAIDYEVVNLGPGSTLTGGWTESFYLSLDHNPDGSDVYLGYRTHGSALTPEDGPLPMSVEFDVPLGLAGNYVVLVETNSNGAVDEGGAVADNLAYDPELVNVIAPDPVDLVIDSVELLDLAGNVITSATPGQHVRVRWNTVNQTSTSLPASQWSDGFYLSTDDSLSPNDDLIGALRRPVTALGPQGTSQDTSPASQQPPLVIPPVPDSTSYQLIARSDQLNQISEADEGDNTYASLVPVSVQAIPAVVDGSTDFELPNDQERWLALTPAADLTLDITLSHPNHPSAWTEVYVREGELPTTGVHDDSATLPGENAQTVRIPRTSGQTYYVLARALSGVGTQDLDAQLVTDVKDFELEEVAPSVAGLGTVTFELAGGALWNGTDVVLRPVGGSPADDVSAQEFQYDEASGVLLALFDLEGETVGDYDMVVLDGPGVLEAPLAGGVTLEPAAPRALGLALSVSPSLRRGATGTLDVTLSNAGNVNVDYGAASLGFRQAVPGGTDDERIEITSLQLGLDGVEIGPDEEGLVMLIEDLGPSQVHRVRFQVTIGEDWPVEEANWTLSGLPYGEVPFGLPQFLSDASEAMRLAVLDSPEANSGLLLLAQSPQTWSNSVLSALELSPDAMFLPGAEVTTGATLLQAIADAAFEGSGLAPGNEVPTAVVDAAVAGSICLPFPNGELDCAILFVEQCDNAVATDDVTGTEGVGLVGRAIVCAEVKDPDDPNKKNGPPGSGPQRYVAASADIPYRIDFENQATAGAWASLVVIEDPFEADYNPASIRLSEMEIGNTRIELPPFIGSYSNRVEMEFGDGGYLLVDIFAGLDAGTGVYSWIFQAIDPETGLPPLGTDVGLLPPTGQGAEGASTGFVSFTVNATPGAVSGTTVRNRARIRFNQAPPLETEKTDNTLDADAPQSQIIQAEPGSGNDFTNVQLGWLGDDTVTGGVTVLDPGSGVATYSVYHAPTAFAPPGAWTPIVLDTTANTGSFQGQPGEEYWFFVEATDYVGNVETATQGVQVVIPGDCNFNGIADVLDLQNGTSQDCDGNGVPDECDVLEPGGDCNGNGVPDACDLVAGTSEDINGNGVPDDCECKVTYYCVTSPNSAGTSATISVSASSSVSVGANDLVLQVTGAVPNKPGLFFYGPSQIQVPFGDGFRCVGGQISRLAPPVIVGANGDVSRAVDYNSFPMNSGPGLTIPGSIHNFQFWYRDPSGAGGGFNLSDAVSIEFCE